MWTAGKSQARIEDDRFLRGKGAYVGDTPPEAGLTMVVVRSPVAAGRLRAVDVDAARDTPGVVAVLTAEEMRRDGLGPIRPRALHPGPDGSDMPVPEVHPLATGSVHYVGHPIAIVLAESRAAAETAAEAVVPDIEERGAVTDPWAARAADAPRVWPDLGGNLCFRVDRGDPDAVAAAMARASHVARQRLRISRVTAAPLEPRGLHASYDPARDRYELRTGTQAPHRVADDVASVLGVPAEAIRVVARDTGGSFGMKNAAYPEDSLALWAARRTGRPVSWAASRTESFLADSHGRDMWADAALALDADGRILGLEVTFVAGLGACMGPATPHPPVANLGGLAGVYATPAIAATVEGVFTNCQPTAPYRGAGRPEATYIIERLLDVAARETGRDRVALRRMNMIPAASLPWATPLGWTYDSGDFAELMERALTAADWSGFPARRDEARARGRLRGIGLANPIEIAGGPAKAPHPEYLALRLAPQGNARLVVGSCDSGQGHATVFRQILADRLGLDPEAVDLLTGDTGTVPRGTGTFGSRTIGAFGAALAAVEEEMLGALRPEAAARMGVAPEGIRLEAGLLTAAGADPLKLTELVAARTEPIEVETFVGTEGATFPNGCHVCEVEIDPETGGVDVVRYTVVDDVGNVINPLLLEGQIAGGVAQGLGQALMERIAYDDTGQIVTASLMDYALPRADDLPPIAVGSFPVPTAANPLGTKGAGEAGTVGALAAGMSAVADALAARGVMHIDMPATPAAVWTALRSAGRS